MPDYIDHVRVGSESAPLRDAGALRDEKGSVKGFNIATGAVTAEKLAEGAVGTAAMADAAITEDKLSQDVRDKIAKGGGTGDVMCLFDAAGGAFSDGSAVKYTMAADGTVTLPPEPTKKGHTFIGWYSGDEPVTEDTPATGSLSCAARYRANTYTVTLQGGFQGAVVKTVRATFGETISAAPLERDGYAFGGYADEDGVTYVDADGVGRVPWDKDADTTLTAVWTAKDRFDLLVFDETTGRYTNDSLIAYQTRYADNLAYGVRIPKYESDPGTGATKLGANAGLVLEASTNTYAGRNDYKYKKLFLCPRVNGGVDADGMPYVTAIEGADERFSATEANTYVLTPVYYCKYEDAETYTDKWFSDAPLNGYKPCRGAYTADNQLRPYILRACYLDSDGTMSSKSGTVPAATSANTLPNYYNHTSLKDFQDSKDREDGLTYLDYGDVTWLMDFMQLMLGVKSPKSVAKGCINHSWSSLCAVAETGVKRVIVPLDKAYQTEPGCYVCVGSKTYSSTGCDDIAFFAKVKAIEEYDEANRALVLDVEEEFNTTVDTWVSGYFSRNGACDEILGTFGSISKNAMANGKAPIRFQNTEQCLGLYEIVHNVFHSGATVYAAPDVDECNKMDMSDLTGWVTLDTKVSTAQHYIGDYVVEKGVSLPAQTAATSTTGYNVNFYAHTNNNMCWWVSGDYFGLATYGVGYVNASNNLNSASFNLGGRSSSIGHSAPAE